VCQIKYGVFFNLTYIYLVFNINIQSYKPSILLNSFFMVIIIALVTLTNIYTLN